MPYYNPNYKVASHTRFNDGTSSDLSQVLATRPGWLLGATAFSMSTAAPAHLFIYDTTAAVTTASVPFWQGMIPVSVIDSGASSRTPAGAGFIAALQGITLDNGLAYAISSNSQSTALSTSPANLCKVSLQYQTSSCL